MSGLKSYTLMLEFSEGGTTTLLTWSKDTLKPDSIIFVIDENTGILWFWIGKANSLVKRRTAMRQADSLKGHGYQIGKNLYGRGIHTIIEIDDRKVGREEENTKSSKKFLELFDQPFYVAAEQVVVLGSSACPATEPAFAPTPKPTKPATPGPAPPPAPVPSPVMKPVATPVAAPTPVPKVTPTPVATSAPVPAFFSQPSATASSPVPQPVVPVLPTVEHSMTKARLEVPKILISAGAPTEVPPSPLDKGLLKMGLVVIAVITQQPDVYVSKKTDGTYEIESMDGMICKFKQAGDNVQFTPDSFTKIAPAKAKAIQEWFLSHSKSI